jgi:hypothetical protein
MTITDPAIVAGDTIYVLTPNGLQIAGTASTDGEVTVSFTTDPAFLLTNVPRLTAVGPMAVIRGRSVLVKITCGAAVRCTGTADLARDRSGAALASTRFSLRAGQTKTVALAEGRGSQGVLASLGSARATSRLTVKLLGGKAHVYRVDLALEQP